MDIGPILSRVTVAELAKRLGVTYWRVAKWRERGKIPDMAAAAYRSKLRRIMTATGKPQENQK
jgi:DNA-binding transcriptional regulator YiaG